MVMHEEWGDVQRSATVEVRLTDAEELCVTLAGGITSVRTYYKPFRLEVACAWPGNKIGNGYSLTHIHANEVHYDGSVNPLRVALLLADLDEVPAWLAELVTAAEGKCFG